MGKKQLEPLIYLLTWVIWKINSSFSRDDLGVYYWLKGIRIEID
jgi:hypothetical protein